MRLVKKSSHWKNMVKVFKMEMNWAAPIWLDRIKQK